MVYQCVCAGVDCYVSVLCMHCMTGTFEGFYLDISKNIISVKIKLIEIKCVTI